MDTLYKPILWTAFVLFSVQLGWAQERVSKTIEKEYPLDMDGELMVENKYGSLTLTGWEQNRVAIKIDVKVNHRKYDTAKSLLSRIEAEIKTSSGYVSVVSKIENKNTGWLADFFNRNNPIDVDRSRVQIDYEIFLPKKAKLRVTNRFGDVFLEDWSGELRALVEHGDLWINDDLGKADVILKFGKVKARNLDYASLNLKNGELDMADSKSLRLNSSGTEISLGEIGALEIYSNKDGIGVDAVGSIYGNLKFTTLAIERLDKEVDLELKIADLMVRNISGPDTEIAINQESSDIDLNVTGFSHRFDATLEQGVVRLPRSFENVESQLLDKSKKLREIKATFGAMKTGRVSIKGVKGIVTLND
ncbi:hypothetical protein ABV409_08215 [Flagellimonas sp. DF-77]|uniref:hypothetical protein n=1 Tax=Flagellimonas algarum TaxID=3230298 RepID=UPI00339138D8